MRLTLVIASLTRGGAERVMSILAGAWAEQGKEVTLLSFDHGEETAYPLHPLVRRQSLGLLAHSSNFLQGLSRNLGRIRLLRRAIRDARPGVVVSFLDRTNILTLLATRGLSVPVIVSERTDPSLDVGPLWHLLRRLVLPMADVLVCPTAASLAKFQAMARIAHGVAIPNPVAVPTHFVRRDRAERPGRILVAMGRLAPEKGFDLLISAFSQVAGRYPQWTLKILGEGPLLRELEMQAEDHGLHDRVRFAGAVADPFPHLCDADLFVFSSRTESFGMALAEAMACGLPVISFDCPVGPSAIIRNGVDGLLVPPENVDALAQALGRLMGDAEERRRLAARAPEVRQRFSLETALALWQQLFETLLPATRVPSTAELTSANPEGGAQYLLGRDK